MSVKSSTGLGTQASPPRDRRAWSAEVGLLIAVALVLLLPWSMIVPIFESPDEPHHWQYARYLHDERRLPLYSPDFVEANSPPLYYALIAPVAAPSEEPPLLAWHDAAGALVLASPPRFFHNTERDFQRYWPIRLGRLLTVLMSVVTVWLTYSTARLAGPPSVALLAASLVAFLPQFTFRGATISNDALVTTLSAATIWCAVRLVRVGFTWRVGMLAAFCLAGAYLTKISAICLAGPLALAVLASGGPLRTRVVRAAAVLTTALLLVLPWSLRNVALYGDPFASGAMHTAVGHIIVTKPLTSPYFWTVFPSMLSRSFVGTFGWMNVWLPEGYYWGYWVLGAAGLIALALQMIRRRADFGLVGVLGLVVILNFGVVVHINRSFDQPQGRYLFPALPALALLVALGLHSVARSERVRVAGARMLAVVLALVNTLVLTTIIFPAYYPPLTADLRNESQQLASPTFVGLEPQPTGELRVTHDDPQVTFTTALDTDRYGFLQFDLSGRSEKPDVVGSVYFVVEGQPGQAHQMTFRWSADGQVHRINVPLLSHSSWNTTATTIRIEPLDGIVQPHVGETIRIDNVRVSDTLRSAQP